MSAKHFVVPHFFPAETFNDDVLPKHYLSLSKTDVKRLKRLGLIECRNVARRLWSWTHRANVLTRRCMERIGGCVSLEVPKAIHESIAEHMADHA